MPSKPGLNYTVSFSEPWAHLIDVRLTIPEANRSLELWMPVWTPGSYMVREYARNVESFHAADAEGTALPWIKTSKNRWRVDGADGEVTVTYRVYGREMTVRNNWVDSDFAFLNGAATFLTVAGREQTPHRVRFELPKSWAGLWTGLAPAGSDPTKVREVVADDLDTLIDSPFLAGTHPQYTFDVDGVPFTFVNVGEGGLWDGAKATAEVETIVRAYRDMYGALPLDRYVFMNLITEGRGGLEHKHSSVLMTSRYTFRRRKAYTDWLGLASHEFFHVWNVKRSRPVALGPFDYENEVYTRTLWVAEGVTAYYTDLMPHRAGVTTQDEYFVLFSETINLLQTSPGRAFHSLEESSYDAWIKLYRQDENTINTSISYYAKGAIVAWFLDVELRRASGGKRTLDDLMRLLYERYSGDTGFTDAQVQAAAEEIHGDSLAAFFDRYVRGRDELDYQPVLQYLGLRFRDAKTGLGENAPSVSLGIDFRTEEGRLLVTRVRRDGAAREAGINAEDEILAIGGYRVTGATFAERLLQYQAGERVEITVARRDALRVLPVTFPADPGLPWRLELDPDADAKAVEARAAWLRAQTPMQISNT